MHTSLGGQNGWWPDGSLSQVILDGQCLAPHSNGARMGGGAWAVGAWLAGSGHSHGKNASKQQENDGELHCAWSGGQIELIWFQSEHLALYRCHRCNKRFEWVARLGCGRRWFPILGTFHVAYQRIGHWRQTCWKLLFLFFNVGFRCVVYIIRYFTF